MIHRLFALIFSKIYVFPESFRNDLENIYKLSQTKEYTEYHISVLNKEEGIMKLILKGSVNYWRKEVTWKTFELLYFEWHWSNFSSTSFKGTLINIGGYSWLAYLPTYWFDHDSALSVIVLRMSYDFVTIQVPCHCRTHAQTVSYSAIILQVNIVYAMVYLIDIDLIQKKIHQITNTSTVKRYH